MRKIETISIRRTKAELELKSFLSETGRSGLVYFRGRRRIGKTTLLKKLQETTPNVFYFIGISDETNRDTLVRFAKSWDEFVGKDTLSKIKRSELDWSLCFDHITKHAADNSKIVIAIIFDEIQWIAKTRAGFVGTIKDKWIDWEKAKNIKLIICGSSNKFFLDQAGGEEKILRGMKTSSDIVLSPITAKEVRSYYFPDWSVDEVMLLYMMVGGVPYYLNQIPRGIGFIRALNWTFFTKKTIFLSEVDEILNIEFNKAGVLTGKKILRSLGAQGGTFSQISDQLKMSSAALFEALNKLVDYSLLKEKALYPRNGRKKSAILYFYDDPYLLFYFCCLERMRVSIEENDKQLLICQLLGSEKSHYIANFSGRAFEIYIRNLLLSPSTDVQNTLLELMGLPDRDFELYDSLGTEGSGEFVLVHRKLRTHIVIECKWTQSLGVVKDGIAQLVKYECPDTRLRVERVLITNYKVGSKLVEHASQQSVRLIDIENFS